MNSTLGHGTFFSPDPKLTGHTSTSCLFSWRAFLKIGNSSRYIDPLLYSTSHFSPCPVSFSAFALHGCHERKYRGQILTREESRERGFIRPDWFENQAESLVFLFFIVCTWLMIILTHTFDSSCPHTPPFWPRGYRGSATAPHKFRVTCSEMLKLYTYVNIMTFFNFKKWK